MAAVHLTVIMATKGSLMLNTAVLLDREMEARVFLPADLERIAACTSLSRADEEALTPARQVEQLAQTDIAITGWGTHAITEAHLDQALGLQLICHSAGSIHHLVPPSAGKRGICVSTARAALATGVAEFAFGMMLTAMKGAWLFQRAAAEGKWRDEELMPFVREPYGAVIGIIGASCAGREMLRLCRVLDNAAVLLYDPYVDEAEALALGAEKVALEALMTRSDVVSLHAPATKETYHMINSVNLGLMKDRAIFINTARGACVDETALIERLEAGRILACLDVTDPEPPAPESLLYTLPNCILTPHIAGAIKENTHRQGRLVADEIQAFAAGKPLKHAIDFDELNRLA
ncbi:MAG: hydroxyacid dehydrogenase [Candidatus Hydrogenedentes bacterium]|nr:hydroxyacid dehydrogenase [Candidatus Hydrogenedentota bacterium]